MRNYNVETKFKKDNIWLIWDILFHYMEQLNNPFIAQIMNSAILCFVLNILRQYVRNVDFYCIM